MRNSLIIGWIVAACPGLALADFTYPDFSSTAGLNLVEAAAQSGTVLRMTPPAGQMRGGAWRSDRQHIAGGFDTTFLFRMSEPTPPPFVGADGLAFVVQDFDVAALGGVGLDISYAGIPRSLAVEIDTFVNSDQSDPASSHLGILSRGTLPNSPDHNVAGYGVYPIAGSLYDGIERSVRIRYVPGTLEVFYDGAAIPAMSAALDLPALIGSADGAAYVGFTSATGAAWGVHDVTSWSFQSVPEPSTLALLAGASVLGLRRRSRTA